MRWLTNGRFRLPSSTGLLFCNLLLVPSVGADSPALPQGLIASLKGHTETVYAVTMSPDGKYVLTGSFDKTLKLWDAATGKELSTLDGPQGHQQLVLSVDIGRDGRHFASGGSDNTGKIWTSPLPRPWTPIARFGSVLIFP